ncbi:hypothetical protein FA95DRAFT_1564086 [Auriscalpium vulgare]|uniref:Uncharacterized protein n=1 Tax=Auriscalpium vulgare TaxID=40419 RepID=A0ACB8RF72_9AGAM|nr:hypothetical protein FA95DRAFT_1564086 [Auriscalpium vulgare]
MSEHFITIPFCDLVALDPSLLSEPGRLAQMREDSKRFSGFALPPIPEKVDPDAFVASLKSSFFNPPEDESMKNFVDEEACERTRVRAEKCLADIASLPTPNFRFIWDVTLKMLDAPENHSHLSTPFSALMKEMEDLLYITGAHENDADNLLLEIRKAWITDCHERNLKVVELLALRRRLNQSYNDMAAVHKEVKDILIAMRLASSRSKVDELSMRDL